MATTFLIYLTTFGASRQDLNAFLGALLTPVRSGIIVTRADLIRGARSMDAGVGIGDRRTMLRALLDQDAERAVRWLSDEAARWARRHGDFLRDLGPVATFWQQRAEATAGLLRASSHKDHIPVGSCDLCLVT